MADKKETLATIIKERDDYRAAIVEFLDSAYFDMARDPRDIKVLVDALGKKRMER